MDMVAVGWISSLLLAACGVPAAIEAARNKTCNISWLFLILWLSGEIFGIAYAIYLESMPLVTNYTLNLFCILIIMKYNKKKVPNGKMD